MSTIPESNRSLELTFDRESPLMKEYNKKGFRIGKAAQIAFHALTVTFAAATTVLAFVACVAAGSWIIPLMIVSAVALSILFTAETLTAFKPYLKGKLLFAYNLARATTVDILAKLVCAGLYPFSQTRFDPKNAEGCDGNTPILLVHGYLHNSSAWSYFRYRMKLQGHKNIFTINLGNPLLSIEEFADKVAKKVQVIQKLTGQKEIQLIGHSMGGVVSSYYASHLAEKGSVKSVITLGSPLGGTHLKGVGKAAKQMRFKSDFIQGLRKKVAVSDLPFYHVGSEADLIIRPTSSAILKEHKYTMFKDLGHVSYLFSDRVIRRCLAFYDSIG